MRGRAWVNMAELGRFQARQAQQGQQDLSRERLIERQAISVVRQLDVRMRLMVIRVLQNIRLEVDLNPVTVTALALLFWHDGGRLCETARVLLEASDSFTDVDSVTRRPAIIRFINSLMITDQEAGQGDVPEGAECLAALQRRVQRRVEEMQAVLRVVWMPGEENGNGQMADVAPPAVHAVPA